MQTSPFKQVDVFTTRPFAGNPLAVIADGDRLDDTTMQRIAAWTNLSETVFLLSPSQPSASYRVRIFTPRRELPFAGHPSVGAAHAVLELGLAHAEDGRMIQECGAGLLSVRVEDSESGRRISVRAPQARSRTPDISATPLLSAALAGLPAGVGEPALIDNGPVWLTVEAASEADLRGYRPDLSAIARLTQTIDAVGVAAFAASATPGYGWVVRVWCPADGIPEDPVTGSANAGIGARLLSEGRLPVGSRYVASQGREVGRDGYVTVTLAEDGVWIGGHAVTVVDGLIRLD